MGPKRWIWGFRFRGEEVYAVVRNYSGSGAKELMDVLEQKKAEVESLIRGVAGAVGYDLVRTADGGVSVTVCENKGVRR